MKGLQSYVRWLCINTQRFLERTDYLQIMLDSMSLFGFVSRFRYKQQNFSKETTVQRPLRHYLRSSLSLMLPWILFFYF